MSKLWSIEDLADYLGVPVPTIYGWRTKKYGPPARRVGKHLRWVPEDVKNWLDSLGPEAA
ncbi:helix-turn-helix transcriptional regulator [Umezawaea beigongshangensis]|uniref:helix-turn-helix transcriptional regulator n=1 Tax=Umezawaea beigongshangensis TaxID=2780383 RepID=UPI0018F16A2D|nr:helix-turn-helix domain-containing protein [Umezawaea beigongshangensis]